LKSKREETARKPSKYKRFLITWGGREEGQEHESLSNKGRILARGERWGGKSRFHRIKCEKGVLKMQLKGFPVGQGNGAKETEAKSTGKTVHWGTVTYREWHTVKSHLLGGEGVVFPLLVFLRVDERSTGKNMGLRKGPIAHREKK